MFDYETWLSMTQEIPKDRMADALRAVVDRHRYFEREPEILAQEIQAATLWHERLDTQADADGPHPWVQPTGKFDSYPPNWRVLHGGEEWVAVSDRVVCGEPGVASEWVPAQDVDAPDEPNDETQEETNE